MNSIEHPSTTRYLMPPPGVSADACNTLPVSDTVIGDRVCVVSFWEPTAEEREAIADGRPIALAVWGSTHPPLFLSVAK